MPVLQQYGLPATVFVMQNAIEADIMWNDIVIEAIRQAPANMDLSMVGLGNVTLPRSVACAPLVPKLFEAFKCRLMQERWKDARELYNRVATGPPPRLMLNESEQHRLAPADIDVGGHTVIHPILAQLPEDEAWREIVGGAEWLARAIGRRPNSFACPNGRPRRALNTVHMRIARDAGLESAVST